jgi:hypothetical protein
MSRLASIGHRPLPGLDIAPPGLTQILRWVTAVPRSVSIFDSIVDLHSLDGNLAEIFTG